MSSESCHRCSLGLFGARKLACALQDTLQGYLKGDRWVQIWNSTLTGYQSFTGEKLPDIRFDVAGHTRALKSILNVLTLASKLVHKELYPFGTWDSLPFVLKVGRVLDGFLETGKAERITTVTSTLEKAEVAARMPRVSKSSCVGASLSRQLARLFMCSTHCLSGKASSWRIRSG